MTDWEHECHGLIYWIKGIEADCECAMKRARNEGLSKSGAINFIDEIRRRCAGIDDEFKRMKKPKSGGDS